MSNYIQPGHVMDYVNDAQDAADIKAGGVVTFPDRIGVALVDIAVGDMGSVGMVGVHGLPKGNANLTQGQPVFWKDGKILAAGTDATPAGYVFVAAVAGDATVAVKIG